MEIAVGILAGVCVILVMEVRRLNGIVQIQASKAQQPDDVLKIVNAATKFSGSVVEKVAAAIRESITAAIGTPGQGGIIADQTPIYEPESEVPVVFPDVEYDPYMGNGIPEATVVRAGFGTPEVRVDE